MESHIASVPEAFFGKIAGIGRRGPISECDLDCARSPGKGRDGGEFACASALFGKLTRIGGNAGSGGRGVAPAGGRTGMGTGARWVSDVPVNGRAVGGRLLASLPDGHRAVP